MLPSNDTISPDEWPHGYGFCWCGCGQKTNLVKADNKGRGLVKGAPFRFVLNHHRRKLTPQYIVDPATECWNWQWTKSDGYGMVWTPNGMRRAHRVYYERARGLIPEGYDIDHLCRNKACVNPDHLEAVPHRENVRRGMAQWAENARTQTCKHGHPMTPENTYNNPSRKGFKVCRTCFRQHDERRRQKRAEQCRCHASTFTIVN